jgi:hypothetical protein
MKGLLSRRCWLGLASLVCLIAISEARAWERPPLKIYTNFDFRVEVTTIPQIPRPTAPWYTYFPADPRLAPSMQTSPYPPWPGQFPPPGPAYDFPQGAPKQGMNPTPRAPMITQHWPTHYTFGSSVQPVGYVPAQAPSYWYQGR